MTRPWMMSAFAALTLVVTTARADTPPSAWDRAEDPAEGERYKLHLRAVEDLHPPREAAPNMTLRAMLAQHARGMLEQASAATSPDLRLRFDLAEAYERLKDYGRVIEVLEPALAVAPRDASSADAWWQIALAYANVDRTREERDAYDVFLSIAVGEVLTARLNRAEAEMRLGNLEEAVAGYRDVLERAETRALAQEDWITLVLARWGLAVALDRNGDPASAEHEAFLAAEQDPDERIIGDEESVFFVPRYERDWYFGLGRAEHAKQEPEPRAAYRRWLMVEQTWADYVSKTTSNDRWLPLARAHLAAAEKARTAAELRLGKDKPPAPPPNRETTIRFPSRPRFVPPPRPHP